MIDGFKQFIFRGNAVDLAVGVIVGGAFGTIVSSLTTDVITPIIGMFGGQPDFKEIVVGPVMVGNFINAVVAFLITAFALYVLIVAPMNKFKEIQERNKAAEPPAAPEIAEDVKLLTEIRDLLKSR
ncbi:MAG: large conductance mechanosensitive channel protein MscL [Bryobacterales bacterium]|jgi:large conductance mechanosensitive channel|nr:large conductance mechanosensitive channel protein MscL [Bryobacterales bacterium]